MISLEKVVVVGGNAAGMSAASKAKRVNPKLEVIVFEKSKYVSYAPCGIPYYLSGEVAEIDKLIHIPVEVFRRDRGIDVRLESEVLKVDPSEKTVTVLDMKTHREYTVEYDKLVLATGAKPITPKVTGVELEGIHYVRNLEDAITVKRELKKSKIIGIVGGGYIGLEIAEALSKLNKKVLLFEMLPHILPSFDYEISSIAESVLKSKGIELHLSEPVTEFKGKKRIEEIVTENKSYKVDMAILAIGVKPNTKLAVEAGLKIGSTGGIVVNSRMETSIPGIYSAGDNTETRHLITGKPTYTPLAPVANKMGRIAGENVAGGRAEFLGVLGTAGLKLFNVELARTGLSEREAINEGFNVSTVRIKANTRSSYYPGVKEITLKLVVDRDSSRLIGAQAVGGEGVISRINTLATALTFKARIRDLTLLDLVYSPPFGPVWDPIIVAANVALRSTR